MEQRNQLLYCLLCFGTDQAQGGQESSRGRKPIKYFANDKQNQLDAT